MALGIGGFLKDLISPVTDLVGEAIVDVDKKKEFEYKVQELLDKADQRFHDQMMGQIEVNKIEAANPNLFVSGWRPSVGWICAAGFGYATVLQPILNWFAVVVFGYDGALPELDTALLITTLGGMLGMSGLRTLEKNQGTARSNIAQPIPKPKYLDGIY